MSAAVVAVRRCASMTASLVMSCYAEFDFGRLGLVFDSASGRARVCHALIFTPVLSRYTFVWLTFAQAVGDVIAGFEAAWAFSGGVFATVIPGQLEGDPRSSTKPMGSSHG